MALVPFADLGQHRWMTSNEERVASLQARIGRAPSPSGFAPRRTLVESFATSTGLPRRATFSHGLYGQFTEGLDTPDLKDAKALLDDLNAAEIADL
jgi:hypothetical protein